MNKQSTIEPGSPLALLRADFPPNQISKLPKETRSQIDARKADKSQMVFNCQICGGHHHKAAVHLDYVGHAALTDRLLDTDIEWTWEPIAFDERGLPARDQNGGLWIKLTVCGVTRLGYGSADGKTGGDAVKEIIGDALRNAAMRFGAALDLWHKGDLHVADEGDAEPAQITTGEVVPLKPEKLEGPYGSPSKLKAAIKAFAETLRTTQDDLAGFNAWMATDEVIELERAALRYLPGWWETGEGMPPEFEPIQSRIQRKAKELEELDSIANSPAANNLRAG